MKDYYERICCCASIMGHKWDLDRELVFVPGSAPVSLMILGSGIGDRKMRLFQFCKAWEAKFL